MTLTCDDIWKKIGSKNDCCGSCHEDYENEGYEMFREELDGASGDVCCAASYAMERWRKIQENTQ